MNQLTLEKLLNLLKDIPTEWGKEPVDIRFDFGTAYPIGFSSWRGNYREVAINYSLSGYDGKQFAHTDLKDFVVMIQKSIGKEFYGWKGGDFTMTEDTPVWVANDGNVGNTAVVGIKNEDYTVIILTEYKEY